MHASFQMCSVPAGLAPLCSEGAIALWCPSRLTANCKTAFQFTLTSLLNYIFKDFKQAQLTHSSILRRYAMISIPQTL